MVSKELGQPVVIENKGGPSGTLGPATMAATAKPDGYIVAMLPAPNFRIPFIQKASYNPKMDFGYIIQLNGYIFTVAVKGRCAPADLGEDVRVHRGQSGRDQRLNPRGAGGTAHIAMEQIAKKHGIKWIRVPYKGGNEQNASLLGGHTNLAVASSGMLGPLTDAGPNPPAGPWTPEREKRFPDVSTPREGGVDMVVTGSYASAARKGWTPLSSRSCTTTSVR